MLAVTVQQAQEQLPELLDQVVRRRKTVIITRREGPDVALIAADELRSLRETVHLLRSPRNARRLMEAIERSRRAVPLT